MVSKTMRMLCALCDEGDPGATNSEITLEEKSPGHWQCPNCGGVQNMVMGDTSVAEAIIATLWSDPFAFATVKLPEPHPAPALADGAIEAEFRERER